MTQDYSANTQLSGQSAQTQQIISEALNNGMEVTIHQSPITQDGWTGAGYMIIDPQTGSGAFEIEGGSRGGDLYFFRHFFLLFAFATLTIGAPLGPITWAVAGSEIGIGLGYIVMGIGMIINNQDLINNGGIMSLAGIIGLIGALRLASIPFVGIMTALIGALAALQAVISSLFPGGN